jgi:hypothetical protein
VAELIEHFQKVAHVSGNSVERGDQNDIEAMSAGICKKLVEAGTFRFCARNRVCVFMDNFISAPHLRIVSDELFAAVERRFETTKRLWGVDDTGLTSGHQKQVYLFSGLLRCGECGGSITLVGGRAETSRSEYGCSLHTQRGDNICKNSLRIQRRQIEEKLLTGLQEKVLREEFIDYVICGLQEEFRQRHDSFESGLKALREEKHRIESELKLLVETIAVGSGSLTIMAAIVEREARIRVITNQVIEPGPESLEEKLEELRTFSVARLTSLRELLAIRTQFTKRERCWPNRLESSHWNKSKKAERSVSEPTAR